MSELKKNRLSQEIIEANRCKKKHWKSTYTQINPCYSLVPPVC